MRVLLVEDEKLAAERLSQLLLKLNPAIEIAGRTDSVRRTLEWLENHPSPDLLFLDVQLADGLSFEIFEKVDLRAPVIFTTAYDEYAVRAFRVNSLHYLLKPIDDDELQAALEKFDYWGPAKQSPAAIPAEKLEALFDMLGRAYKERFIIKVGDHIRSVEAKEVDHFVSQEKATFLQTREGKRFIVDFTLDQVEGLVDPAAFFRINRKYLVAYSAIKDIVAWSNSRLRLVLHNCDDFEVIVAREKVNGFKEWLDK